MAHVETRAVVPDQEGYAPVDGRAAHLDARRHHTEPVLRAVRAFNPTPGAWAVVEGERLKVWEADDWPDRGLAPGRLALDGSVLLAGTGRGSLRLISVQAANRRRMSGVDWARGRLPLGTLQ